MLSLPMNENQLSQTYPLGKRNPDFISDYRSKLSSRPFLTKRNFSRYGNEGTAGLGRVFDGCVVGPAEMICRLSPFCSTEEKVGRQLRSAVIYLLL